MDSYKFIEFDKDYDKIIYMNVIGKIIVLKIIKRYFLCQF